MTDPERIASVGRTVQELEIAINTVANHRRESGEETARGFLLALSTVLGESAGILAHVQKFTPDDIEDMIDRFVDHIRVGIEAGEKIAENLEHKDRTP